MANTVIGASVEIEFQSVGNMRKALKEANQELLAMQDQFGATSQQAINAARKVADLKDRIEDARETADLFDPGKKFQAFVTLGSQIAAGFGAVQGAMALIGSESEAVEKSLLKVQSAMALAQGLSQLRDFGKSWQQLNIFIQSSSVFMKANAAANALAAGAMRMFGVAVNTTSTSFKVLKGAIVSTGIGALLVVVGLVVEKLMAWANQASRTEKAIEGMNAATKKLNSTLDNQIAILEAVGNKEEEIYQLRQQQANNELATLRKTYAERSKEGQKFTAEEAERFEQLKTQVIVNDINERKRKQKVEEDKKKDRDKAHSSELKENKAHNTKINKQNDEAAQARAEAENILFESRKSLMSQRDAELLDLEKKRVEEEKKLIAAGVKDRSAFDESYRKQKQAIDDKYNEEDKKKQEDFNKQINKINTDIRLAGITDEREKEREQLNIAFEDQKAQVLANEALTEEQKGALILALTDKNEIDVLNLKNKYREEDKKKQEEYNQKLIAADQQLYEAKWQAANAAFGLLSTLAGKNEKLQNVIFAVEKAAAIAKIIIDTQKEIGGYFAAYSAIPGGVALAAKLSLGAKIRAGASIASVVATTIGKFRGGGGATPPTPAPPPPPPGTTAPLTPELSPAVQGQALNAQAINNLGNNAMRAYVLNSDIQNNDQRNAYLQRNARIG